MQDSGNHAGRRETRLRSLETKGERGVWSCEKIFRDRLADIIAVTMETARKEGGLLAAGWKET